MIESYPDNKTSTTTAKIDGLCLGGENVFDSLSLSLCPFYSLILIQFDSIIMAPMVVVVVVMVIILEWNVCGGKVQKKQTNK